MQEQKANLSERNHLEMDAFLSRVLDAYKNEELTKKSVISGLAQVMSALDIQNTSEAINWFNQDGVTFFTKKV